MYYIANFKKSKLFDIRRTFFALIMQFDMSDVLSCPTKNTVQTLIPHPLKLKSELLKLLYISQNTLFSRISKVFIFLGFDLILSRTLGYFAKNIEITKIFETVVKMFVKG